MVQALLFIDSSDQLLLILVIALLIFGPTKLPQLGSSFGKAIRSYREGLKGDEPAAAPANAVVAAAALCPKCGAGTAPHSAFCTRCGSTLQQYQG